MHTRTVIMDEPQHGLDLKSKYALANMTFVGWPQQHWSLKPYLRILWQLDSRLGWVGLGCFPNVSTIQLLYLWNPEHWPSPTLDWTIKDNATTSKS